MEKMEKCNNELACTMTGEQIYVKLYAFYPFWT